MKPIPEAVQRAFPCAPDRLPERPWRSDMTSAKAAAFDAEHPLPHPGYRAGQVWADDNGASIVVGVFLHGKVWTCRDADGWFSAEFARAYPYLMADPACPHLAPWSSCEEVKP